MCYITLTFMINDHGIIVIVCLYSAMIYVTTYYGYEYDRLLRTIKAAPVSTHMHGYGSLDTYVLWKDSAVQFVILLRL